MLRTEGFTAVSSMEGGMHAWQGLTAAGVPEAGMSFFTAGSLPEELIALAWVLEEGSRRFYAALADRLAENGAKNLFADLAAAEDHHKTSLLELYRGVVKSEPGPGLPRDVIEADEDRMEGGVKVSEALAWAEGRDVRALLDLSMALEMDSYDLYIKMTRAVPGENARQVFDRLVGEEKEHLRRMAALLDRTPAE
ncbi:MAG: ferritin-like domain-containing protein [Nitrospirota bacterium]